MKLGYKIKPRDAKSNPTTAILAAVFVMFLISGLAASSGASLI